MMWGMCLLCKSMMCISRISDHLYQPNYMIIPPAVQYWLKECLRLHWLARWGYNTTLNDEVNLSLQLLACFCSWYYGSSTIGHL
jgi:hypothetical protein